jgi:hypothetical protein
VDQNGKPKAASGTQSGTCAQSTEVTGCTAAAVTALPDVRLGAASRGKEVVMIRP